LSSDGLANLTTYALDTEIRYRDSLDNSQISDMFKTEVRVVAQSDTGSAMQMLPAVILIAAILTGSGYYVFVKRKKV
jgi:LPXTG-motif cell wall-anchored protein